MRRLPAGIWFGMSVCLLGAGCGGWANQGAAGCGGPPPNPSGDPNAPPIVGFVLQTPLNPSATDGVSFSAEASHPTGMASMTFQLPAPVNQVCPSPPASGPMSCVVAAGPYPAGTQQYSVTATSTNGKSVTVSVDFQVGPTPGGGPIRVYGSKATTSAIDLIFIPDRASYQNNFPAFLASLTSIIQGGFYGNEPLKRGFWNYFNIYYVTDFGEAGRGYPHCDMLTPPGWNYGFGQVAAIIHSNPLRDCAAGNIFTAEANNPRVVMHELGHAAFGLFDEYCCDGGYWEREPYAPPLHCGPNIYTSEANCQNDIVALPKKGPCLRIDATDNRFFWRSDLNPDIMVDNSPQFEAGGTRAAQCMSDRCAGGGC